MTWSFGLVAAVVIINGLRVLAKAFQQISICHGYRALVPVGSFAMAATEVLIMGAAGWIAVRGTWFDLAAYAVLLGVSGAAGSLIAMRLHPNSQQQPPGESPMDR